MREWGDRGQPTAPMKQWWRDAGAALILGFWLLLGGSMYEVVRSWFG